ncbi:GyrI-like domain-containing protein [Bacillus sp. JJ1122]|uniref:GyrI-like domain-containing protein n=1 Tax=Bacillus sp. JJ1122 TaxID=3122951 RepID=UPI002FFDB36D
MEFRKWKLDGGQYVLYSFYDKHDKLNFAYQYMFREWLPNSDYGSVWSKMGRKH